MKKFSLPITLSLLLGSFMVTSAASASSLVVDDLLTGSNLTTPWQECGTDSEAIDVSNLDAGGCAFRTTPAEPGVTYSMTCGIQVVKAASITLAFLDADDNTLAKEVTEILEHVSGAYTATLQAPAGTVTAAIGIYGEPGSAFQDCVLADVSPLPEPTKGSIAGTTWFDESADSVFDGVESVISGTPVTITFEGAILAQTHTDADGQYYFGNLDVDACYTVSFDSVDSTVELGATGSDNDAEADGMTQEICLTELDADITDVDAAFVAVAPPEPPADLTVCGVAWVDANANGMFDGNDTTLSHVDVQLIEDGVGPVANQTSNANGNYAFTDLTEGSYSVQFAIPDGHEPTVSANGAQTGKSYIGDAGATPVFSLLASDAADATACTLGNVNGGFVKLPVALDPTIANDDKITDEVGTDFSVAVLDNDEACDGVYEFNLLGHNVPGNVTINAETNEFLISSTVEAGTYSIEYGVRGNCGSYDTATVTVVLEEAPVVLPPDAPDAPVCRIETGGSRTIGGVDVFNTSLDGFSPEYNMYDRDKNLVVTVSSDDYTHQIYVGQNTSQWRQPYIGSWEIEWNGTNYGYDQVSIYYVAALENGVESALTECDRTLVSPIALDLDNKGRIQRIVGDFEVDLNNDGINEALGQWFAPSAGILVTANAQGQISGHQLFGNVPGVYTDGFAELATLDTNKDGQLSNDELNGLAVWTDLNSDTIVDDGELSSLADHQIVSLGLQHYKFMSRATKSNGNSILMEDVWLPHAPMAALSE